LIGWLVQGNPHIWTGEQRYNKGRYNLEHYT